jgi:predicted outer membrane repeat protein
MPPHPPCPSEPTDTQPAPADPAALRALLAATAADPWRASLFMRRLTTLRERLGELRAWLADLPRQMRRAWSRRWATALPAAALLLALVAGQARAAAITVDPGGSGCTLEDAITAANTDTLTGSCGAGSGPDTISFANANTNYALDTNYGAALPDITTVVTIQGNGTTTLDAEGAFGVLRVTGGGSLALLNATIIGGSTATNGGGIYVYQSTLSVTSATIGGNSADDRGGGIHASGSTVNGTSVTISGNSAGTGGGIYAVGGSVSLTSATISGNSADDAGGGIAARTSTVSLTSATITGNTAGDRGGGIHASGSTVNGTNVTISSNSADTGGGIYVVGASVSLTSATITGNSAGSGRGGGVYVSVGTVGLTSATVTSNSADDSGGGIHAVSGSSVDLTSTTVSGNTAAFDGGGIAVQGARVTLANTTISGNTAGDDGGGIAVTFGSADLTNATISGNSAADDGGGIYNLQGTVSLTHATVTGNSASAGGGVFAYNSSPYGFNQSTVTFQNSIVAGQAAGPDCAGGTLVSAGYNIESAMSCGFTGTGDQDGVTGAALNLSPLAPNAPGTTSTHALVTGSVALDQIPPGTNGCGTTFTDDQRGVGRPQSVNCDVGAYELAPAPPTPTAVAPTAAEVTHFAAVADPTGRIRITWATAAEVDVAGFRLQRAASASDPWRGVGEFVPARGGAASGAAYTATDAPGVGHFAYRLEVVDAAGAGAPRTHGPVDVVVRAMRAFLPWGWRR